ncbi:hypothetical protein P170DRAFT_502091 [Aspergillus steynii IBT 23096]|uniref:MARVEL domain-containing protein n=1 Tax=Aspergillus steynii IBT 23096 TaxID=1392250 RepID=A0A2I2FWP3_9EURO|nr:uncharacterized protein P170DRAFT_502091 [Aspergillus steynii IBT 23096]PLB45048.1 hypothetical protein P170DRAFT_502091 [Aspergillus steynii IBT 23096]
MAIPAQNASKYNTYGAITRLTLRILQFTFAIVVAGIYGADLAHATKNNAHAHAEWIYAEFVVIVSALTAIAYLLAPRIHGAWAVWDAVIVVLWVAQAGVFGTIFTADVNSGYEEATLSVARMKAAVWIDLMNLFLWLATTILGIVWGVRGRRRAGRAHKGREGREDEEPVLKDGGDMEKGLVDAEDNDWSDWMDEKSSPGDEKGEKSDIGGEAKRSLGFSQGPAIAPENQESKDRQ